MAAPATEHRKFQPEGIPEWTLMEFEPAPATAGAER